MKSTEAFDILLNPLKPKLIQMIFKNSVRTAKKTNHHYKDQVVNVVSGNNRCLQ
jgi:hypothetical protein